MKCIRLQDELCLRSRVKVYVDWPWRDRDDKLGMPVWGSASPVYLQGKSLFWRVNKSEVLFFVLFLYFVFSFFFIFPILDFYNYNFIYIILFTTFEFFQLIYQVLINKNENFIFVLFHIFVLLFYMHFFILLCIILFYILFYQKLFEIQIIFQKIY